MSAPDRLTTFFADLDKVLAVLATPEFQVAELQLRLAHNERCKAYLCRCTSGENGRPLPSYTAFDLTAIECGLVGRLIDAERRRDAEPVREAA